VSLKFKFGYDDSLDVVGVHLVGGVVGTLLIGILATAEAPAGVDGLFYGGGFDQLWRQAVAAGAVLVYSFVLAYIIGTIIHKTMGFRIEDDAEVSGIDLASHAESAYELGSVSGTGWHAGTGATTKQKVDA
jgi:Amt family ammonium transporter